MSKMDGSISATTKSRSSTTDEDLAHEGNEPTFEQLFDLRNDPDEMTNLIASPEAADMADRLRTKCAAEVTRLNQMRAKYASEYLKE